jgi:hypothetical protein
MLLTGCVAPAGAPAFLEVSGEETSDIALAGNDLSKAQQAVRRTSGVRPETVRD